MPACGPGAEPGKVIWGIADRARGPASPEDEGTRPVGPGIVRLDKG